MVTATNKFIEDFEVVYHETGVSQKVAYIEVTEDWEQKYGFVVYSSFESFKVSYRYHVKKEKILTKKG